MVVCVFFLCLLCLSSLPSDSSKQPTALFFSASLTPSINPPLLKEPIKVVDAYCQAAVRGSQIMGLIQTSLEPKEEQRRVANLHTRQSYR